MVRRRRRRLIGGGPDWDADAAAYFATAGVDDEAYMAAINTMIAGIKSDLSADNFSDIFDCFWIFANQGASQSLYNAAKDDHHCTNVNSTTFTAGEGYTGNGSSMRLATDYIPSTDAVVYEANSASWGFYARLAATSATANLHGGRDGTNLGNEFQPTYGAVAGLRINSPNFAGGPANDTTQGFFIVTRTGAGTTDGALYYNGVARAGAINGVSTGLPTVEQYILCVNANGTPSSFSANQIAVGFYGRGLTAGEVALINTRVEAYMDALGKGVQ